MNSNDTRYRFTDEHTTRRRRGFWALAVVLVLVIASAVAYLVEIGGDWRGALHMAGTAADEAAITARIESELAWSDGVPHQSVDVSTQGGIVRLRGTVPSEEVRQLAVDIAASTDGVERVEDQILVESLDRSQESTKNETKNERSKR